MDDLNINIDVDLLDVPGRPLDPRPLAVVAVDDGAAASDDGKSDDLSEEDADMASLSDGDDDDSDDERPLACQRCAQRQATVVCRRCLGQFLCETCDASCHRMHWQTHAREPLTRTNPLAVTESLLSKLVGLDAIKDKVREMVITHAEGRKTARLRGDLRMYTPEPPVMLLVGNPGVGKTTIANTLAQVFVAVGLVSNPTVVHLRKDEIPSNSPRSFFDQLAGKVRNGCLVVDELQNYARCTNFTQFLVAQTDKGLVGRPVVVMMGYPAPRRPNVEEYLRKSDSGLARRLTVVLQVPDFTAELVTRVLLDKIAQRGYQLDPGLSEACVQRYVSRIPQRVYAQLNGSLAERIVAQAATVHAKAMYTSNAEDLEERLTLAKATVKTAVKRVREALAREELAITVSTGPVV